MPISYLKTRDFLLDLIFPRFCVGCHKEGTWLCPKCLSSIVQIRTIACCHCGRLAEKGICQNCRRDFPLTGALTAGYYRDPILREAIHTLKYEGVRDLAPILSSLLIKSLQKINWPENCLLIPIPLHRWRQSSRGFNQAELIARPISSIFNWPIRKNILIRTKMTTPQIELKPKQRLNNVKDAFKVIDDSKLPGKTIILVDDVITTGATAGECARVLRSHGATRVWAIALARG